MASSFWDSAKETASFWEASRPGLQNGSGSAGEDSVRLWLGAAGDCSGQTELVEGRAARGARNLPGSQPGDTGATCRVSHQDRKWQTTDHRPNAAGRLLP